MITEEQLDEIRNYLLTKKLPIDVLMEVNDHFISQMMELQKEGQTFEEAFTITKNAWRKDLKPYWSGGLDIEDKSDLMRRIRRESFRGIFFKAALFGLLLTGMMYVSMAFLSENQFLYLMIAAYIVFVFGPVLFYFMNRKDFALAKKYSKYVLTEYQMYVFTFISFPIVSLQFLLRMNDISSYWYSTFHSEIRYDINRSLVIAFGCFLLYSASIFIFLSQRRYLRHIQKVKPFLKYLKQG